MAEVTLGMVMEAFPDAFKTMDWFAPPPTEYVTVAFGVPVKATIAGLPWQTGELLKMEAAGRLFTVIVTEPFKAALHAFNTDDVTLTSIYVVFAVKADVVMFAEPDAFNVMVWFAPPSTLYVMIAFGVPLKLTVLF